MPPAWPHCTATMNRVVGTCAVGGIGAPPADQHPVEDPDRVQLTRPRAEERISGRLVRRLGDVHERTTLIDPRLPQLHLGRQLILLPRVRSDSVAEQRLVVPAAQAIVASVLLIGPPDRQIGCRRDLVVDDRLLPDRWSDDRVSAPRDRPEQFVEVLPLDDFHGSHREATSRPSRARTRRAGSRCDSWPTPGRQRPWLDSAGPRSRRRRHAVWLSSGC